MESRSPDLVVENAVDPEFDPLGYFFELDRISTFDSPHRQVSGKIPETADTTTTAWSVSNLQDDTLKLVLIFLLLKETKKKNFRNRELNFIK